MKIILSQYFCLQPLKMYFKRALFKVFAREKKHLKELFALKENAEREQAALFNFLERVKSVIV